MRRVAALLAVALLITMNSFAGEDERERRSAPNRALARALHGSLDNFRTRVEWSRNGRMATAEFFGTGAGVWNDERAFRVTPAELREIARTISDARFAAMPDRFGEGESDFLTMRGKVTVSVGDAAKTVVQIDRGAQSDALAGLASAILARAEVGGRAGVGAASLEDGLAKIASGAIPAEVLRVTAQVRGENGFLLQIRGGEATARRFDPKGGYGPARRTMVDVRPQRPQGVYAPVYTELRVEVLGRSEEVIGRPETKGAPVNIDQWRAIAEMTLKEGIPAPAVD